MRCLSCSSRPCGPRSWLLALLLLAQLVIPGLAAAHEFTVAIRADNADELASAIRGMRLAATERDGHANETSDGHLGGLDLFILPRPAGVDHGINWLMRPGDGVPAITVLMDAAAELVESNAAQGIVIGTGQLSTDNAWDNAARASSSFSARYEAAYGEAPDLSAARAYNAARRIDQAVRALGSVTEREELAAGLAATRSGLDW